MFHLFGQEKGYSCGYPGLGTWDQFCLLCRDTEEAEDVNCKSEAKRRRENFSFNMTLPVPIPASWQGRPSQNLDWLFCHIHHTVWILRH
jgi:hypothetical protein